MSNWTTKSGSYKPRSYYQDPFFDECRVCWPRDRPDALSAVRSQGNARSCWALSSADHVSFVLKVQNPSLELTLYAGQDMIDGVHQKFPNKKRLFDCKSSDSCYPASPYEAYEFIKDNGLSTEAHNRYTGKQKKLSEGGGTKLFIEEAVPVEPDYPIVSDMLNWQPLKATLISYPSFDKYTRGVYKDDIYEPDGKEILDQAEYERHGLLIVGCGIGGSTQKKFYLVKNTWGTNWGSKGLAKIGAELVESIVYVTKAFTKSSGASAPKSSGACSKGKGKCVS